MNELSGYGVFEVAGEQVPFKFGVNAYSLFCKSRGIDLGEIGETGLYGTFKGEEMIKAPDMTATIELAYFAYVTARRMKGGEPEHTLTEFTEMVGDTKDVLSQFQNLMLTSRILGYTFPELAEKGNAAKKK